MTLSLQKNDTELLRPRSADLYRRAQQVMPGGNSRVTIFFPPHPPYADHGSGCRITDVDGVERIDFVNNYSSLIHGHCPPAIVEAVRRQVGDLFAVGLPTESEIDLAELITGRVASIEHIRFANSGTEGVMFAVKAARAFTGRPKIAKIEGAFHGSYDPSETSLASTPENWGGIDRPAAVALCHGTPASSLADTVVIPHNNVEVSRRLLREAGEQLAGVLIDPLPSRLHFMGTSPEFLAMLREETERLGALLIFDEVYSFRLGFGGAQEALGIRPDLTALGKIIGGGMPVGAVGGRADVMRVFVEGGPKLVHGGTYNANPVTMVAGRTAMEMLDREAFARLERLGDRLRAGMAEILARRGIAGTVRGQGSLASIRFSDKPANDYRDIVTDGADMELAARLHRGLLDSGIFCTSTLLFILSTPMDEAVIDTALERIDAVLAA
ncbi:aspartate aminotransferase family protein [Sphingomonas canadensis]|uniref:Aspartate aminotransferase family protein n=1 Tax=Sphingomonas canadensis TaxID=1219257 RepID=A0ABW3H8N7_9SPHN|nr:aspartate aminotransferase family protein [Sphingomonas canadensis]MCW3836961.1 aspartate aminotransferase family protein [Sphingomonas canadensis]